MIIAFLWTACFVPLWLLPEGYAAVTIGSTLVQFGVQGGCLFYPQVSRLADRFSAHSAGAWGVIPIYLSESSPPAFRAIFAGTAGDLYPILTIR